MTNERNLQTNEIPSKETMIERNMVCYALATMDEDCYNRGLTWYPRAHDLAGSVVADLEEKDKIVISLDVFCKAISIVSPGRKWAKNIPDAKSTIQAYFSSSQLEDRIAILSRDHVSRRYGLPAFQRVWSMLDGIYQLDKKTSPKTWSFADNLYSPLSSLAVTIDQHNCHILLGENDVFGGENVFGSIGISSSQYRKLEAPMYECADLLGLSPMNFQAILWEWRQDYASVK